MQNQLRLDELLARDVIPQWFEGVAVVQLICRQLRAPEREASRFPRAEHILIASGGSITIAGASDEKPVETAAHVLGLMLGNDVPVRLRLAMTQATAMENGFASLAEFSEALAYFERPNPEAIVEAFRRRAMAAAPREIAPPMRTDAVPVAEKKPAPAPAPAPRRVSLLSLLAAFSVLTCALIWLIGPSVADALTPKVVATNAAEAVAADATHAIKKSPTVHTESSTPAARTARRVKPLVPTSILAPTPELQVVATTVSYAYPTPSVPDVSNSPVMTQMRTTSPADVVSADDISIRVSAKDETATQEISDRIYSQADPQVTLPLSVYPKFRNDTPGATVKGHTTLELTIAANGLVERVRMLTEPRNIHEFMLLSAAKAWRFEPARIGGRPVRFRQIMTLTSIP